MSRREDIPLPKNEKLEKIQKYEEFIENKLKVQLQAVLDKRDEIYTKTSDYLEVKNTISLIKNQNLSSMKTLVNLGSDYFVQAKVSDTSHIFVEVGLGFHAQFTLDEALEFIDEKMKHLTELAEEQTEKSITIKTHIKLVYEGINELMNTF